MNTLLRGIFLTSFLFATTTGMCQGVKNEAKSLQTKIDIFESKTGAFTKFIDSRLPNLKLAYLNSAETRVRKLISGNESMYFYQIKKKYNIALLKLQSNTQIWLKL